MWPFEQRKQEAEAQAEKANSEYEWAVQNRTTVQALVEKIKYHGDKNNFVENLNIVIRGHK